MIIDYCPVSWHGMTILFCNRSQGMNVDYGPNNDGKGCPVK